MMSNRSRAVCESREVPYHLKSCVKVVHSREERAYTCRVRAPATERPWSTTASGTTWTCRPTMTTTPIAAAAATPATTTTGSSQPLTVAVLAPCRRCGTWRTMPTAPRPPGACHRGAVDEARIRTHQMGGEDVCRRRRRGRRQRKGGALRSNTAPLGLDVPAEPGASFRVVAPVGADESPSKPTRKRISTKPKPCIDVPGAAKKACTALSTRQSRRLFWGGVSPFHGIDLRSRTAGIATRPRFSP